MVALLSRTLHIGQIFEVAKLFDLLLRHLPLVLQVRLVPDQEKDSIFLGVGFDFVHPELANVLKAEGVSQIEDQ